MGEMDGKINGGQMVECISTGCTTAGGMDGVVKLWDAKLLRAIKKTDFTSDESKYLALMHTLFDTYISKLSIFF